MAAWLRQRLRADDGLTLPEMLVSITIMAVVSGALVSSVVAVNRSLGTANATLVDTEVNQIGVQRIGQLIRGATSPDGTRVFDADAPPTAEDSPLVSAGATDLTLYSFTGTDRLAAELGDPALACSVECNPIRYRLWLDGDGNLWEERVNPDPVLRASGLADYSAPATHQRVIARDVLAADEGGQPLPVFRYWSHYQSLTEGDPVTHRCGREFDPGAGSLDPDDARLVDSISFQVAVHAETAYDNTPVELRGWARLASTQNLGFSITEDPAECLDTADGGFAYAS